MKDIFENKTGEAQVKAEGNVHYLVEKVDYDKGVWSWLKGAQYPQKGNAPAETIFYINIAKRIIAESLKNPFILLGILMTRKQKLIQTYNSILWKVVSPFILKLEYMTGHARQVRIFTEAFLNELKFKEADRFASIFSHFLEYDNAYRYRVQDLLTSTTKEEFMCDTQKVLKRFKRLSKERDSKGVSDKICAGITLLSILLLIPKYKRAFIKALDKVDFKEIQFDEIDIYWISMRTDYLYLGEQVDVRAKRNEGKSMPIPMPQEELDRYIKDIQQKNNEIMILRSIDVLLETSHYRKIIKDKLKC